MFSPRHVTGVNAAAKAAVSTSARTTVARITAIPPTWNLPYLNPYSRWLSYGNPSHVKERDAGARSFGSAALARRRGDRAKGGLAAVAHSCLRPEAAQIDVRSSVGYWG